MRCALLLGEFSSSKALSCSLRSSSGPPSYRYAPARLKTIINQLDPSQRNVVEFRHASLWNYRAFEAAGIIFCSCSGPKLPDELIKTADYIYVRFHGAKQWYRHDYSTGELTLWARRIKDSGAKRVWAYFNNDRQGFAIKNAQELFCLLTKPLSRNIRRRQNVLL